MPEFILSLRPYWGDLCALGSALCWSVAVICFQLASARMRTVPLNIFKNALALVFIALTLWAMAEPWWHDLSAKNWLKIAVSGILGITLGDVLLLAALRRIGSSLQAIVACIYAPIIVVLAFFMFGEVLPALALAGGLLVIAAVWIGSKGPRREIAPKDLFWGMVFGVLTHVTTGLAVLMIRDLFHQVPLLWLTGARLAIGEASLILAALVFSRRDVTEAFSRKHMQIWIVLATFFGTYLSLLFWLAGYKYTLAGRAAIYNQLSTVFTIALAAVFLKEKLTAHRVAAVALGILGALIVSWS